MAIILIHTDALRREYKSNLELATAFRQLGHKVILTSRLSTSLLLKVIRVDLIILSHVFTLSEGEFRSMKKKRTLIIINEVEGVYHSESGVKSTYPLLTYGLIDCLFVWNKWTKDWLIQNRDIDETKVIVSGSIRNTNKMKFDNVETDSIGLISRFELINPFDDRHLFQNLIHINPLAKENFWFFERMSIDAEVFSLYYKIIDYFISAGRSIIIRPHPNENTASYRLLEDRFGARVKVDDNVDVREWLNSVKYVVGPLSTVYFDAYVMDKVVISTERIQRNVYTNHEYGKLIRMFEKYAYLPKTFQSLINLLETDTLQKKESEPVRKFSHSFYNYGARIDPIDAITNYASELFKETSKKRDNIKFIIVLGVLILIDGLRIIQYLCSSDVSKSLTLIKNYHLNTFLHFPNFFAGKNQ